MTFLEREYEEEYGEPLSEEEFLAQEAIALANLKTSIADLASAQEQVDRATNLKQTMFEKIQSKLAERTNTDDTVT